MTDTPTSLHYARYSPDLLDSYLRVVFQLRPGEGIFGESDRKAMCRLLEMIQPPHPDLARMREALEEAIATMRALNMSLRPPESISLDVQRTIARCQKSVTPPPKEQQT